MSIAGENDPGISGYILRADEQGRSLSCFLRKRSLSADLIAHMEANRRATEWAQRCLDLRAAGKLKQAKLCEGKAKYWLRRTTRIEARVKRTSRHDAFP